MNKNQVLSILFIKNLKIEDWHFFFDIVIPELLRRL